MTPPQQWIAFAQWVGYRSVWVEERGKYTKKPVKAADGSPGSSTDSTTWSMFHEALQATQRLGLDGVGFVLTESDPFTVIDLDRCRDPQTGEIEPWAWEIVQRLNTYTEISPSGTGLHIVLSGRLPVSGKRKGPIEVYYSGRYVTVTGKALEGYTEIHERADELVAWFAETFPEREPQDAVCRNTAVLSLDDEAVLQLATNAVNGPDTMTLYSGDTSRHGGDHSAADLALLSRLAFYTQDPDQLDRLFRTSGLYRAKWERADYRDRSIARALEGLRETYNPGRPNPQPARETLPAAHTPEVEALQARIEQLERDVAAERERANRAEEIALREVRAEQLLAERDEQVRRIARRLDAVVSVLKSHDMDPIDKVAALGSVFHLEARENTRKHTDPELGVRAKRSEVAASYGIGEDAVTKAWKKLEDAGYWKRTETSWWNPEEGTGRKPHTETSVWFAVEGEPVERIAALAKLELPRKQGGKRERKPRVVCQNCGKDHIDRKVYTECQDCGVKWDDQSYNINERIDQENLEIDAETERETLVASQNQVKDIETLPAAHTPTVEVGPSAPKQRTLYLIPPPGEGIDEFNPHEGYSDMSGLTQGTNNRRGSA